MNINNIEFIWGESINRNEPAALPTVSVSAWPYLLGKAWLRWRVGEEPTPSEVLTAKVALVNVFWGNLTAHITHIRQNNPNCYIIAAPDPSLDMVLAHPEWVELWRQLSAADMIAGRTPADNEVYGTIFGKPTFWLPSPIGPTDYFAQFRNLPKEDYLITCDHQFAPPATAQNLAVVALVQRDLGMRVIYFGERDHTRELAKIAGLDIDFRGHVDFKDAIDLTARAKVCLDLYDSHSYGRQGMLCGIVGTPCVTSKKTLWGTIQVDSFNTKEAAAWVQHLWTRDPLFYEFHRQNGFTHVEHQYGLDASRQRLTDLLEQISEAHHLVPSGQ